MSIKRILGVLALALLAAPVTPGLPATVASPGITVEDPLVTEARTLIDTFVRLWKQNKLEELVAGYFTEDALMLPPNHEPIRGHRAILAYFQGLRDAVGEFDQGDDLIRATPSGGHSVSWVGQFSFRHGKLRVTTHELFVRQPDGSMRCTVKMVGFRDPMA